MDSYAPDLLEIRQVLKECLAEIKAMANEIRLLREEMRAFISALLSAPASSPAPPIGEKCPECGSTDTSETKFIGIRTRTFVCKSCGAVWEEES